VVLLELALSRFWSTECCRCCCGFLSLLMPMLCSVLQAAAALSALDPREREHNNMFLAKRTLLNIQTYQQCDVS
jgi:hypothetical protein